MAGGSDSGDSRLSSSEVYEAGSWELVGELPAALSGLRGASLQNNVFMMGRLRMHLFIL